MVIESQFFVATFQQMSASHGSELLPRSGRKQSLVNGRYQFKANGHLQADNRTFVAASLTDRNGSLCRDIHSAESF